MIVIGMLSGTSMDGLDVAVADIEITGGVIGLTPLATSTTAWSPRLHKRLLALLPPSNTTIGEVCELDTLVGKAAADAASAAPAQVGVTADLICWLGQTAYHWVRDSRALGSLQLGQPAWIAERTGLPVVSDLRTTDIAAGGHGAPLASTLDALWLAGPARRAALNIGGIANITVVAPDEPVVAYDTGPGNCLIDVVATRAGCPGYDVDGALATRGRVDEVLLAELLADPYYSAAPPKSTGRELFTTDYLDKMVATVSRGLSLSDIAATLVALTARTVALACSDHGVTEVIGSGGGMRNPVLVAALRAALGSIQLRSSDELGLPSDAKEAYLTALLGFLTWNGLPGVVPGATGSTNTRVLGRITPGHAPLLLPEPATAVTGLRVLSGDRAR